MLRFIPRNRFILKFLEKVEQITRRIHLKCYFLFELKLRPWASFGRFRASRLTFGNTTSIQFQIATMNRNATIARGAPAMQLLPFSVPPTTQRIRFLEPRQSFHPKWQSSVFPPSGGIHFLHWHWHSTTVNPINWFRTAFDPVSQRFLRIIEFSQKYLLS